MIRQAQAAGQFYPAQAAELNKMLKKLLERGGEKTKALGLVAPHAGYIYSGKVAGLTFAQVELTKTVIILGPNHTGLGAPFSIMTEGSWATPLGNVEIDTPLAEKILSHSKLLRSDAKAHSHEHSIEVELPFLRYLSAEIKIVPITLAGADLSAYQEIGSGLAGALEGAAKSLIIASSDMTHYESAEDAKVKDEAAIAAILKLDGQELFRQIEKLQITMCGYGPVITMLEAARELGASQARLVKYETSGEATGDYSSVVGYAGIIVQ